MRLQYVAWIASDYFELLRGENDSKQSDEFQAIQYVEKLQKPSWDWSNNIINKNSETYYTKIRWGSIIVILT